MRYLQRRTCINSAIHINQEKWLNEFLATCFLICFIKEKNLAPMLEKDLQASFPVQHRSLAIPAISQFIFAIESPVPFERL